MKLIRVDRTGPGTLFFIDARDNQLMALKPVGYDNHMEDPAKHVEFFLLPNDRTQQAVVDHLAKANPGFEIQVFTMEEVSWCPPGEVQKKEVTKDGVIPRIE